MHLKGVKNRLKDETLDLSLCDLKEVPVREIATIKKATHLDLSSNLLTSLPVNFVQLKQIVKLDLSRNMLTEIPVNFGELRQLKHLDLYGNQISRLPLSLSELKNLRWLDLKENPLTPAVASVAGPCSNSSECQACAHNIVAYLSQVKVMMEEVGEKLRKLNTADTEKNSTAKKGGKKKKKKVADKKQDLDSDITNSQNEEFHESEPPTEPSTLNNNHQDNNEQASRGSGYRFLTLLAWSLFFGLLFILIIVILPLYVKEAESFVNYIEANTGVRLKDFRKHSIDTFDALKQAANNVYNDLYRAYDRSFKTETDIPR
ncbi:leucine-rich repeat-containing protein 59 [Ceratina calcarata]|uniref:Leucine-rich repeat-containing protein 59 n=1 Tax=Ceratina calcarata TaxID=156304 RepID=A0AAJ7J691_9HYME|nr:leucine-rich repeat-containing protein 59 [Ceratina calcarata]